MVRIRGFLGLFPVLGAWAAVIAPAEGADSGGAFEVQDLLPRTLQKRPKLELTVITEMTPAGRKATPATPQKPVYYVGFDAGMSGGGDVKAGERQPSPDSLRLAMNRTLAVNGYLPGDTAHPAALMVLFRWGSFNPLATSLYVSDASAGMDVMDDAQRRNLIERAQIVGGSKFGEAVAKALAQSRLEQFSDSDPKVRRLMDQAKSELYYVIASAFDAVSVTKGQRTLLWWTKVSCTSTGLLMDEAVPALVAVAGPYIGREMTEAKPIEMRLHEGRVEIGEPTVKGYESPAK